MIGHSKGTAGRPVEHPHLSARKLTDLPPTAMPRGGVLGYSALIAHDMPRSVRWPSGAAQAMEGCFWPTIREAVLVQGVEDRELCGFKDEADSHHPVGHVPLLAAPLE
jgi:hypothetical protein